MPDDNIPIRRTTHLAVNAVLQEMQRALNEVADAALADGEISRGYVLDVDKRVWRKVDIAPSPVSASNSAEPVPSSG